MTNYRLLRTGNTLTIGENHEVFTENKNGPSYYNDCRLIMTAAIIGIAGTLISSRTLNRVVDDSYRGRATGVANSAAATLDIEKAAALKDAVMAIYDAADEKVTSDDWGSPEFDAYMARFAEIEQTEEFLFLRQQLRSIQDVNEVDCVYLTVLDPVLENIIYLVDGAYEDACPPGCIDPLYEVNRELLTDPSLGFKPYITNTETYGWLVSTGPAVYDAEGNIICYAVADISMEVVRAQQAQYVLALSVVFAALTIAACLVAIWLVNRAMIRPINRLSSAMVHFNAGNKDNSELDELHITTGDEIQSLYESCRKMTHDIRSYIENLGKTSQELTKTKREAAEMNILAHRDALTGVGSKLAYDGQVKVLAEEMQEGRARYGIVMVDMNGLKQLNDTYGHEKGNVAIKKTCALICDVFAHSPVYRFGGDEFVIVVKDRDYDSIEDKIRQFKELSAQTAGEPWERVNAAIGYALYDSDDAVDDVFRRADHIMYEHKKEMKAKP